VRHLPDRGGRRKKRDSGSPEQDLTWAIRDWLAWAEPFGLGELQLRPDDFWHLSYREFRVMREGFQRREDRAWERIATLGIWLLAPYTKKQMTPALMLGRQLQTLPPRPPSEPTEAEIEAEKARVLAEALKWARE
jgi:hypothetical protein